MPCALAQTISPKSTIKALLSPRGSHLFLDTPKRGLLERGLAREGAYLKFWLRGEGLIREGA